MRPVVPLLEPGTELRGRLQDVGAGVSNLYRALSNHPALARAWVDFAWTLRGQAQTPRALRELIILRCAQRTGSDYVWADHVPMALAAGLDQRRIDALAEWVGADCYGDAERAVVALADEVVAGVVSDDTGEYLRARFAPSAIVELVLTAAFYVMVPRVIDGLRIPHEVAR
jgi:4-carboxymuconolactone decarboxylase